jgi:hypothetical protein
MKMTTLWRGMALGLGMAFLGLTLLAEPTHGAQKKFPFRKKQEDTSKKPVAGPPPRSAMLTTEAWQKAPMTPLKPGELDTLVARELSDNKITPAPLTSDEQFIRRVTLDLTGELPAPADVTDFVRDTDSHKRAKLIDRLLDSEEYARHWARYWRSVVSAHATDPRALFLAGSFEEWMFKELKRNASWGEIARAMIASEGSLRFDEPDKNGSAYFLLAHRGAEAANERAAETSRVFLGIQIQCAQCHDHPFDQWKRVQFHELAGYFARVRERPIREGMRQVGFQLVSIPRGEHEMPSKEDPKKTLVTNPRFLNGHELVKDLPDLQRRQSLANDITSRDNYWFAGAYVNRIWGVLMGQSFYEPVDDMGPQKAAVFPTVLTRLTGSFRGSNYNMKTLFRDIMNSDTYQRQVRLTDADEHLHFAAAYPTRLPADALWQSLTNVLGSMGGPRGPQRPRGPFGGGFGGMEGAFKVEFNYDPSLRPDEVEGSIPQALMMMNNPEISRKIQAQGTSVLARILKAYPSDTEALQALYLKALARKPTSRELERCVRHIADTGNRTEAFEDILWALLNSTEFQTKR